MPTSQPSSSASASCQCDWRPSRHGRAALIALAGLAALSVLASDLSPAVAWPLACAALLAGIHQVRRYARAATRRLSVPAGSRQPQCDGVPMRQLRLHRRGPLLFLHWRAPDGRPERLVFWSDTLPAARRRELWLALQRLAAAGEGSSMAG
jgi:toxin CptA